MVRRTGPTGFPPDYAGENQIPNEARYRAAVEEAFGVLNLNDEELDQRLTTVESDVTGGNLFFTVTDDAGNGTISDDADNTDFTGQIGAEGSCASNPEGTVVYYRHKGAVFFWTGLRPSTVGICTGSYDSIEDDYTPFGGLVEWDDVQNKPSTYPPSYHTHLEQDITDLDKYDQADVDAKDAAIQADLDAHKADLANPHNTSWSNLLNVPADFPPSPHTHVEADITNLDKYSQSAVDAKDAAIQADLDAHKADTANPHSTSWSNLLGVPADFPPSPHTHVEADITDLNRTRFRKEWVDGGTYELNDWAWEEKYEGVANKTTMDHVSPQEVGDPEYIYQGTIGSTSAPAKQVIFGVRYDVQSGGYRVDGWRINVVAGNAYEVFTVLDPLGTPILNELAELEPTTDGWLELAYDGSILPVGTVFDMLVRVREPDPVTVVYTLNYDYDTPNNAATPATGHISHANKALAELRVNKTDNNGDPTGSAPDGDPGGTPFAWGLFSVGDIIEGAGVRWSIQSVTDNGTWVNFGIAPASQGTAGNGQDFTFETVVIGNITIPRDDDLNYWDTAGYPQVAGLFFQDASYDPAITNRSAYGIDLLIQAMDFSEDWDLLPQAGSGGSTGDGGGGVTTFEALTDTPAGYGSAGQGVYTDGNGAIYYATPVEGVTDHGLLNGLADNDHPQYLLVADAVSDYLPLAGGTMTGTITSTNATSAILQGDDNSAIRWVNSGGVTRFQTLYDTVNDCGAIWTYDTAGGGTFGTSYRFDTLGGAPADESVLRRVDADGRYVDVGGDVMTGALDIDVPGVSGLLRLMDDDAIPGGYCQARIHFMYNGGANTLGLLGFLSNFGIMSLRNMDGAIAISANHDNTSATADTYVNLSVDGSERLRIEADDSYFANKLWIEQAGTTNLLRLNDADGTALGNLDSRIAFTYGDGTNVAGTVGYNSADGQMALRNLDGSININSDVNGSAGSGNRAITFELNSALKGKVTDFGYETGTTSNTSRINYRRTGGLSYMNVMTQSGSGLRVRGEDADGSTTSWANVKDANGWSAGSDPKLKSDIVPFKGGMDAVLAIDPISFTFKDGGRPSVGFNAAAVVDVVPQAVTAVDDEDDEGNKVGETLNMYPMPMIATLWEAVKTLEARVAELEAELKTTNRKQHRL